MVGMGGIKELVQQIYRVSHYAPTFCGMQMRSAVCVDYWAQTNRFREPAKVATYMEGILKPVLAGLNGQGTLAANFHRNHSRKAEPVISTVFGFFPHISQDIRAGLKEVIAVHGSLPCPEDQDLMFAPVRGAIRIVGVDLCREIGYNVTSTGIALYDGAVPLLGYDPIKKRRDREYTNLGGKLEREGSPTPEESISEAEEIIRQSWLGSVPIIPRDTDETNYPK